MINDDRFIIHLLYTILESLVAPLVIIIPFAKGIILLLCLAMLSLGFSLQGFKLLNDFHGRTELIRVYRQFESLLSFFFVGEVGNIFTG